MKADLQKYLSDLFTITRRGDAREESFYPALAELIDNLAVHFGKKMF